MKKRGNVREIAKAKQTRIDYDNSFPHTIIFFHFLSLKRVMFPNAQFASSPAESDNH